MCWPDIFQRSRLKQIIYIYGRSFSLMITRLHELGWKVAILTTGCITAVKVVLQLAFFRKPFHIQKDEEVYQTGTGTY